MRQIIKIKNCNCISEANISIQEGELNIKYGPNGTGKSSISEAIFAASQGNAERLGKLKPYSAQEGEEPTVEGLNFSKVRVFDENYIQGYDGHDVGAEVISEWVAKKPKISKLIKRARDKRRYRDSSDEFDYLTDENAVPLLDLLEQLEFCNAWKILSSQFFVLTTNLTTKR